MSTPVDPNVIANFEPNAGPGTVAHASQLRRSLADTISNFSEPSAAAASTMPPSAAALRDLGAQIANAS